MQKNAGPRELHPKADAPHDDDAFIVSAWLTRLPFDWTDLTGGPGSRDRPLAKDAILFLEGQSADTVYVIVDGRIRLTSYSFDGKERHLMILGANGLVGDCGLLSGPSYVVSAVAASDAVVRAVPVARLNAALDQHPKLRAQQQALAGMRFRIMLRHLGLQGANSSRRRVCLHLGDLVHSYGIAHDDGRLISIAFTQQEMGSICGLSRVSVSHTFSQLERDGVITRAGRLVVVRDMERLALLSRS